MSTVITQARFPDVGMGWTSDYPRLGKPFNLEPTGKHFCLVQTVAVPAIQYIQQGCTGVSVSGNLIAKFLPLKNRGTFLGTDFIRGPAQANEAGIGGRPLSEFTNDQCIYVVDNYLNEREGYMYLMSGAEEAYGADEPWKQAHHLPQSLIIEQRLAERSNQVGGKYWGTYDGHLGQHAPSVSFRNVLSSANNALAFCKDNANFGNGFFSQDRGAFRNGLIKTYFMGGNAQEQFAALVNTFAVHALAMQATGWISQTMAFGWNPFHEQEGYSRWYRHFMANGYHETSDWPIKPFVYSVAEIFLSFLYLAGYYGWEAAALKGWNPDIIIPDEIDENPWLTQKYYGSGNPQRGGYTQTFDPNFTYAYPSAPEGVIDATWVGASWYRMAWDWSGGNWTPIRTRKNVGGSYFNITSTYNIDAWEARTGYSWASATGPRASVFHYDDATEPGDWMEKDFELPNGLGTITRQVTGGVPYLWFVDTNAQ
ncbi:hypothetical protein [Larkinella arboricola]